MNVEQIKEQFQQDFGDSYDLVLVPSTVCGHAALYAFIDGLIDRLLLEQGFMQPLSQAPLGDTTAQSMQDLVCSTSPIQPLDDMAKAQECVAQGDIALYVEEGQWYMLSLRKFDKRSIAEPPTSAVIKGPREGFGEDIAQNTTMLRRRFKDRSLIIRKLTVGRLSHTPVAVCWLSGVADSAVVDEITRRIQGIDIDTVIDSAYIGQLIEDNKGSLYPQYYSQEKPDIVAGKLAEGRVAVIVDGSPMVLTFPCLLVESFQDAEDYYRKPYRTTFLRLVRTLGLVLAVLLPAAYVAVLEYHYQIIPLKFLITVINATNGVPFSPTIEMFVVLVIFEILNEASVRMPKYVGMALSIVGAIVLGETAVNAGLLSSPAVLVMALSAIGLYATPDLIGSFGIMRFVFLVAASLLGLLGLLISVLVFVGYTVTLTNLGTDYTAPLAPLVGKDIKDSWIKRGLQHLQLRPYSIPNQNRVRMRNPVDTEVDNHEQN